LSARCFRFDEFELDGARFELRRNGRALKLERIPLDLLILLAEKNGEVVTRQEIIDRLWGREVFVDTEHGINTAIRKIRRVLRDDPERPRFVQTVSGKGYRFVAPTTATISSNGNENRNRVNAVLDPPAPPRSKLREALNDSADNPKYIETLPRVGYRFIAPVPGTIPDNKLRNVAPARAWWKLAALVVGVFLLAGIGAYLVRSRPVHTLRTPHALTRLTFDEGLQSGVTWSPDSRFIAYSSDRGGKFDIWVGQVSGGDPVQITKGPGQNWQPNWSPDGKYIAYRSEGRGGGLFIVPALGGEGLERRVADFGYQPRWSPRSSQILFRGSGFLGENRFYVVALDGSRPREVPRDLNGLRATVNEVAWHPDGRITMSVDGPAAAAGFWIVPLPEEWQLNWRFLRRFRNNWRTALCRESWNGAVSLLSPGRLQGERSIFRRHFVEQ
jgi:DNA-binding winged helix-turn-helix (wHTH) protein